MAWDERLMEELHKLVGKCGHCGKKACPQRASWSNLPAKVSLEDLTEAIKRAKS